jgi:hypothetical protein
VVFCWRKSVGLDRIQRIGGYFHLHVSRSNNGFMNDDTTRKMLPLSGAHAQPLVEFLKANPEVAIESKDDAKCKAFLGQLGILDLFKRASDPNLSIATFHGHRTHWIVGLLWSGYSHAGHNGYQVFCLPKKQIKEEGVKAFLDSVLKGYGGYGHEESVVRVPPDWRKQN